MLGRGSCVRGRCGISALNARCSALTQLLRSCWEGRQGAARACPALFARGLAVVEVASTMGAWAGRGRGRRRVAGCPPRAPPAGPAGPAARPGGPAHAPRRSSAHPPCMFHAAAKIKAHELRGKGKEDLLQQVGAVGTP